MSKTCAPRYRVRVASNDSDRAAAEALRLRCFRAGVQGQALGQALGQTRDWDAHDALCRHVLIERAADAQLLACFRLLTLQSGAEIDQSYSAQFYDLSALRGFDAPLLELGRFCIAPEVEDTESADILRLAWAELTRVVDGDGVGMLFGCSSFSGVDPVPYQDVFGVLREGHLAPVGTAPGIKAHEVVRFGEGDTQVDRKRGLRMMPPLLRTYLTMGGWVSDHAVVDRDLNTLHVFTGLEISAIPPARARLLRALVGET